MMQDESRSLYEELDKARQTLRNAQAHLAELEARLLKEQASAPTDPEKATADRNTVASDLSIAVDFAEPAALTQQGDTSAILLEREGRYHRVLDNLLEGCQIIGFDWRYLYVNDSTARHGHQTKEELIGHTMMEKYPGIENTRMFAVLRRCMEERVIQHIENEFVYPDGSQTWFELSIQPIPEGIFVLSLDITEHKQAEKHINKLNRTLTILSDVNQAIVRIRQLLALYEAICQIAVEKGDFGLAWIGLLDSETQRVTPVVQITAADNPLNKADGVLADELSDQSMINGVLGAGKWLVINDIAHDPQAATWRENALPLGYHASAVFPLSIDGKVRGTLNLYANEVNFFDSTELRLLQEIAGDISFAMEFAEQEAARQQAEAATQRYAKRMAILHQIDRGLIQQAEAAMKRYVQRIEILRRIDFDLIQRGSIQVLIETALKHLRQIIPFQQANVVIVDEATEEGVILAVDLQDITTLSQGIRMPTLPDALEGYDARNVRVIDDIPSLSESNPLARQVLSEGMRSWLSVLLMDQDRPIGSLGLLADTPGFFNAEYQEIAIEISSQLAIAIRHLRLTEALARHATELEQRVLERTAELQSAKERVEAILNNSADGILLIHPDLRIQQTNAAFNRLFACASDDYLEQSLITLAQAEDSDLITKTIQAGVAEGRDQNVEVHAQRKNGGRFEAELSIGFITNDGYVGSIRDITERKRAEAAVREQRDFLQLVINTVPDLIMVKDRSGHFQLVNDHAAQVYGVRTEDMIGNMTSDFNPYPDEVARIRESDLDVFSGEQAIFIPEEVFMGRYYQTTRVPLKNPDGLYDRLLIVSWDIDDRKKAEVTLQKALDKEKDLGELKSRFVSMASHEFRTPLATIMALTETLKAYRHRISDEQIDQRLDKMQFQVEHLKNIIEDVLQLSQMQARRIDFNPVRLDLDSLCRSVLDEAESQPGFKHRVIYTCAEALYDVRLDKKLMRQIIGNLLSNAIKYSPAGKPITISLDYSDTTLVLRVSDEGIGIPEADLKHLFEPFHRASNVGAISGTGLGLVITKEAVELQAGTITLESRLGEGTTFVVRIPILADE